MRQGVRAALDGRLHCGEETLAAKDVTARRDGGMRGGREPYWAGVGRQRLALLNGYCLRWVRWLFRILHT